jgi:ribosomal protein L7/L12
MERDLFHFHFIAQQTLQELVDRQCFTLDMIAAVHCKFNQLFDESDRNFEQVYKHLHAFFDITEEKLIGMNNRLTEAEKNIDLLNWHATLTIRRNYSGVKYAELKDIEKMVYLTRDFFEVTKGNWSDQNFLLLESAIEHLQLSGSMNLLQFFSGFDRHLVEELLKPVGIGNIDEIGFDSLFMLKVLLQEYDLAGASLDQAPFTYQEAFFKNHLSIRDLIFDLLSELSVLQELTRPVEEEKVVYEVVLHQFSDADLRIDIVREIKYHTGLSLETCRSMVKNVPTSVIRYDSYEEAQQLKSKLEQHQCVIEIV